MPEAKRRVLCAEPHADICEMISLLLRRQGHEVVTATTIHDCLELARREKFDLYMLDDDYIDGSSLELCKELRALTPDIPVLFFSSAAFGPDRQRALEAGAYSYLIKPSDVLEIVQTVNSIFQPPRARTTSGDAEQP